MNRDEYDKDRRETIDKLSGYALKMILLGAASPGSAAAVMCTCQAVLAAVMAYAAHNHHGVLLELIDTINQGTREKTTDIFTEFQKELQKHGPNTNPR